MKHLYFSLSRAFKPIPALPYVLRPLMKLSVAPFLETKKEDLLALLTGPVRPVSF